jgi:hypothetical protein
MAMPDRRALSNLRDHSRFAALEGMIDILCRRMVSSMGEITLIAVRQLCIRSTE